MIPRPKGWSWEWIGDAVLLTAQDAPDAGGILYLERVRPVAPAADLLRAHLATLSGAEILSIDEPEELVTAEGEHAALVGARVRLNGAVARIDFGIVYGDDYYARIGGFCRDAAHEERFRDAVRGLTLADQHYLGTRRRPCRHRPPHGWQATARGFDTVFTSADGDAMIHVAAALPSGGPSQGYLDEAMAGHSLEGGLEIEERHGPRAISTPAGLHGSAWELRGAQGGKTVHRLVVHLQDERYIYTIRLDATSAEALRAAELPFLQVTHSIVPVPSPARRVVNLQADAMSMWL